jgi:Na+/phosphate symporter
MTRYGTLRVWAAAISVIGVIAVVLVAIGTIVWAFEVDGVWATLGVIFLGAPLALFLASWPFALSQMRRALADVCDAVSQ